MCFRVKSRREWKDYEDLDLLRAYKVHGNRWKRISELIGRPSTQVHCIIYNTFMLITRCVCSVFNAGRS